MEAVRGRNRPPRTRAFLPARSRADYRGRARLLLLDRGTYALPLVPSSWVPSSTEEQALLTVGTLGIAIVAESALKWYGQLVYEKSTLETLHEIRTTTYATATGLSMSFYDEREKGDVLSVLADDVDNLSDLFAGVRDGVLYGGGIVSAFAAMLLLNWNLALVIAVLPFVIAALGRVYASLLEPHHDAIRETIGTMKGRFRDAIEGLSTVKAFTREPKERARVSNVSEGYKSAKWSAIRLLNRLQSRLVVRRRRRHLGPVLRRRPLDSVGTARVLHREPVARDVADVHHVHLLVSGPDAASRRRSDKQVRERASVEQARRGDSAKHRPTRRR
ncbi:ABC transporter transmembrane domain-containing protein [Halorussus caseinilyticus]|uniref:ABC transporter transmembrane domain-containing protein n=1 Tax=Halorussus caseinilyticus TaxID=3034025 RepID=A0ABD5WNZ5_9EURY